MPRHATLCHATISWKPGRFLGTPDLLNKTPLHVLARLASPRAFVDEVNRVHRQGHVPLDYSVKKLFGINFYKNMSCTTLKTTAFLKPVFTDSSRSKTMKLFFSIAVTFQQFEEQLTGRVNLKQEDCGLKKFLGGRLYRSPGGLKLPLWYLLPSMYTIGNKPSSVSVALSFLPLMPSESIYDST
ncbi:hypothetical protein M0802_007456 [Mischocyttarus mexicanus]|nr:hypothetical protein M0802_007456 [Mischocyttarus mexicanus]